MKMFFRSVMEVSAQIEPPLDAILMSLHSENGMAILKEYVGEMTGRLVFPTDASF
jgi:hypothetical protein